MGSERGVSHVQDLMGTVFTISVFDDVPAGIISAVFDWLRSVESTFSTFLDDSEISRFGRGEIDLDGLSSDVRHVLARCAELEDSTDGRFSIRSTRPTDGSRIDPAGFVKGWSVDEAALQLQAEGIERFVINAGGDVLCVGAPPEGGRWSVGIRHPESLESLGAVLNVTGGAVATSGTYLRGDHIWGSRVGSGRITSVTVVGPSLGVADALATAVFGDQAPSLAWLSRFPEYGVLLMTADHRLQWTPSLDGLVSASPDTAPRLPAR